MERIRPVLEAIAAAGVLLLSSQALSGQEQRSVSETIRIYLTQDCGTGDPQPDLWLRRVVDLGQEAVPILVEAVRQGPPAGLLEEVGSDAEEDYQRLQSRVEDGDLEAIEEEEVVRLARELDRETYVAMRLRSFERPYRERALNAIAAMQSATARESLEELARDESLDASLAEQAREALRGDG